MINFVYGDNGERQSLLFYLTPDEIGPYQNDLDAYEHGEIDYAEFKHRVAERKRRKICEGLTEEQVREKYGAHAALILPLDENAQI